MQALPLDEFHHQVDGLRAIDSFVKLAYVLVIHAGLDAYLSNSLFTTLKINQLKPIVLLNCNSLTRTLVETLFYHRICSTSDLLPEMVRVNVRTVRGGKFPDLGRLICLVMVNEGLFCICCVVFLRIVKCVSLMLKLLMIFERGFVLFEFSSKRVFLQVCASQSTVHTISTLDPYRFMIKFSEKLLHNRLIAIRRVGVHTALANCFRLI